MRFSSSLVGTLFSASFLGAICAGGCTTTTPTPAKVTQFKQFAFRSPMNGELAAPGDTLDVSVEAPPGLTPTLTVDGNPVAANWTSDPSRPTLLHTPFKVPDGDNALYTLAVSSTDPSAVGDTAVVATPKPIESASATVGSGDTVVTLPSGARLTIPAGALLGGDVLFSSYDPNKVPNYPAGDPALLTPVYRVHTSADDTSMRHAMLLEVPIGADQVTSLRAQGHTELDTFEGPDPDPEAPPMVSKTDIVVQSDGTGMLTAPLAAESFHHTGSAAAILGIWNKPYPFRFTSATIGTYNDSDQLGSPQVDFLAGPQALTLSNSSGVSTNAHVTLTAKVEWTSPAPDLGSPFPPDLPIIATGAFSSLRPLKDAALQSAATAAGYGTVYRQHEGEDLRADYAPLNAIAKGTATLVFGSQYTIRLDMGGGWEARYLHISNVELNFAHHFSAGQKIGRNLKKNGDVIAPVDGDYNLNCHEFDSTYHPGGSLLGCAVLVSPADGSPAHRVGAGCDDTGLKDCLGSVDAGVFTANVNKGDRIGVSGRSATVDKHLHLELRYRNLPLDAAYFYKDVSDASFVNGSDTSRVQSPVVRIAAQLDDINHGGAVLGIDSTPNGATALQEAASIACPYGGAPIAPAQYKLTKVGGTNLPTDVTWDLGDCIFRQLVTVDSNNKPQCTGKTASVRVGTTSWWKNTNDDPWRFLDHLPDQIDVNGKVLYEDPNQFIATGVTTGLSDSISAATITCCDGASGASNCTGAPPPPAVQASDLANMTIQLPGASGAGAYPASTVTLPAMIVDEGTIAQYQTTHPNEAGKLSSGNYPSDAKVFSFLDNAQSVGIAGFPATVDGHFMNRNGRSNLVVIWKDNAQKYQWVWRLSAGAFTNGGLTQWHEYQFIYDSTQMVGMRNRLDKYLGQGGQAMNWTSIATWPVSPLPQVTPAKVLPYRLPDTLCPMGSTDCNGLCVDLTKDNNNCGSCGKVCSGKLSCISSQCK